MSSFPLPLSLSCCWLLAAARDEYSQSPVIYKQKITLTACKKNKILPHCRRWDRKLGELEDMGNGYEVLSSRHNTAIAIMISNTICD